MNNIHLKELRKQLCIEATATAKKILKPGDKLRVKGCGGVKSTITFSHFEGEWIISKSGLYDIHAVNIELVNKKPVFFANKIHQLNTHSGYFNPIWKGNKKFLVRQLDRIFNVGDTLILIEYVDGDFKEALTGREIRAMITYVLKDNGAIKKGYTILSFAKHQHYNKSKV